MWRGGACALFAGPRRVADLSRDEVADVERPSIGDGERDVEDRTAQRPPDVQRDDAAIAEQRVGLGVAECLADPRGGRVDGQIDVGGVDGLPVLRRADDLEARRGAASDRVVEGDLRTQRGPCSRRRTTRSAFSSRRSSASTSA